MEHRRLAFYKNDKTSWTVEEYNKIIDYCEENQEPVCAANMVHAASKYKYIYDSIDATKSGHAFIDLTSSAGSPEFKKCEKVCYEYFFGELSYKVYSIEDYNK